MQETLAWGTVCPIQGFYTRTIDSLLFWYGSVTWKLADISSMSVRKITLIPNSYYFEELKMN